MPKILDGEVEAGVIALYHGRPPKGYANWSLRQLAGKVVELRIVDSTSHETVRRTLKKQLLRQKEDPILGDPSDAEFVAHQVLEIYEKPYDPKRPVVCMDEQPVQLIKETRKLIAATENHLRRVDYEYERAGAAFMFCETLSSWCRATARKRRTMVDRAEEVASLLEGRYADCEKITLACDNLDTRTPGAFCEAFEPARARGQANRVPLHAEARELAEHRENELRIRQCLRHRRLGDTLRAEISAWAVDVNERQRGVD